MISTLIQPLASPLLLVGGGITYTPSLQTLLPMNISKTARFTPAFSISATAPVETNQQIAVALPSGTIKKIPAGTLAPLDFGNLHPGTDYAVHCLSAGTLLTSSSFTPPAGGVLIGGFHHALGSNAIIPPDTTTFFGDGPALVRSGNFQVSTGNFYFRVPSGDVTYEAAAAIPLTTGTVPVGTWAIYRISTNAEGTIYVHPGHANTTVGYTSEAEAIAALPTVPADDRAIGYITVRAAAAATFTPGTDALLGGTGGNVAQDTRYYSESSMGPSINPYSIWDLNFRPTCPDPRGMACIAGKFWMDIYLTNNRPDLYGTSAANQTIADGSSRAARPLSIGGKADGTLLMPSHNWWDADLLAGAYGKSLPSLDELQEAALGATQGIATVWDRGTTAYYGALTSMYGLCQTFGQMWVWATDAGNTADQKALMGGYWYYSGSAGARNVSWSIAATTSVNGIGSRFRSDHLIA